MTFPLGARGEYPVLFEGAFTWDQVRELTNIPGVVRASGGIRATWDAAPIVGAILQRPLPPPPIEVCMTDAELEAEVRQFPGLTRYFGLGLNLRLRDYQKDGAIFLARRAYAINADPMRSGKTAQALTASVFVDSRRTLIVSPALAKWVWAAEIAKWLKEEAVVLEGLGSDSLRVYCLACDSRGHIDGKRCEACKMGNGQSRGFRLFNVREDSCRKHKFAGTGTCPKCIEALHEQVEKSRYVIVNYDLLVAQKKIDAAGGAYYRDDLQGWGPFLAQHRFDLAIADEAHLLRGFSTDQSKKGTSRREKFNQVVEAIPRVWALTGTPVFGYTRDLWGQLDAISRGCVSGGENRLPFSFHVRYCEGHKGEYGWKADGRALLADTELPERLKYLMIKRPRSQILASMPAKVRQVVRIDDERDNKTTPRIPKNSDNESRITRLMRATFDVKVSAVVENVIAEMAEGNKVVVFALLRESAERLEKAIARTAMSREFATKMREVNAQTWLAHGDASTQARFEMSRAFREHEGAGAFVTTIDAVQVAVSLKGATSVHFAEMHWQPSAMLQAEDRPYELGVTGLSIVYYVVRGSIDEHMEQALLPKIEALIAIVAEQQAKEVQDAWVGPQKDLTLDEIIAALTKNVDVYSLGENDGDEGDDNVD